MSQRIRKINSVIQQELSQILLKEGYEDITGLLTITGVDTSGDLAHAKVFFSVVGQDQDEVKDILEENIYEIQGKLNDRLVLRKLPRIKFFIDDSAKYSEHIRQLIDKTKEE